MRHLYIVFLVFPVWVFGQFYPSTYCAGGGTFYLGGDVISSVDFAGINIPQYTVSAVYTDYTMTSATYSEYESGAPYVVANGNSDWNSFWGPPLLLYQYFSEVDVGQTYSLTVDGRQIGGVNVSDERYIKIYIDWNQDGVFDPVSELALTSGPQTNPNDLVFTGTINVPLTALSGVTTMRIFLSRTDDPDDFGPCSTMAFGEAEDYSVVVSEPFVLTVDAGTYPPICYGDSTQLNATSNGTDLTYLWTSINAISDPNISNPFGYTTFLNSFYYVQVTDGLGNTAIDSVNIHVSSPPLPSLVSLTGTQTVCEGEIPANLGGTYSPFAWFLWTPNDNLSTAAPVFPIGDIAFTAPLDTTTTFVAEVYWDPVCTTKDSVTVTVIPAATVSLVANSNSVCVGDSITLTATPSNPSITNFQFQEFDGVFWNGYVPSINSSNSLTVTSLQTDTAIFRVRTEDNGCNSDWSTDVQVPLNPLPTPIIIHN